MYVYYAIRVTMVTRYSLEGIGQMLRHTRARRTGAEAGVTRGLRHIASYLAVYSALLRRAGSFLVRLIPVWESSGS